MKVQACVFDAYGTLFDVHSAVGKHRARLGKQAEQISNTWRRKQLEYTWLRSLMGAHADFWQVTKDALVYAFDQAGVSDRELQNDLMEAYLALDCYPEVPGALAELKQHGVHTAILSNGSPKMLEAGVQNSGLAHLLDKIISVEEAGIFKPHPRVYQLALNHFGVEAQAISFQSSNAWDVAGAAHFGMQAVWVNRFGQAAERLPGKPSAEIRTLAELPGLLE